MVKPGSFGFLSLLKFTEMNLLSNFTETSQQRYTLVWLFAFYIHMLLEGNS